MEKALIGYGGHAREVMAQMGLKFPCFVDDYYLCEDTKPLSSFDPERYIAMIAISDPMDRFNMSKRLPKETKYFTWIHPTSLVLSNDIEIGEGSFIGAYSILTSNIKIGSHAILNRSNHIGHDSTLGNFFSSMPGSILSGNVEVGHRVYIGTNSSVKEKINIVDDVTIGMNSGVIKDIISPGTYVGTPALKIR